MSVPCARMHSFLAVNRPGRGATGWSARGLRLGDGSPVRVGALDEPLEQENNTGIHTIHARRIDTRVARGPDGAHGSARLPRLAIGYEARDPSGGCNENLSIGPLKQAFLEGPPASQ